MNEEINKEKFHSIFFIEKTVINGEVIRTPSVRYIPEHLSDKFSEEFPRGKNKKITGEDIDKFLEENKKP